MTLYKLRSGHAGEAFLGEITGRRDAVLIAPLTTTRFIAAALVVFYHSGATWVLSHPQAPAVLRTLLLNFYVSVTYFFTLSGFILHFTYRGGVVGAAKWKNYGVARFARIYPVYLLAVLAMLPFARWRGLSDLPQFLLIHWWLPDHLWHWRAWNLPTWTLSIEFFLYLCFPFLSRLIAGLESRWVWATIAAAGIFVLVSGSAAIFANSEGRYGWMLWTPIPLLRLPEFVIGICAGELHLRREGRRFPVPSWLLALLLLAGLCISRAQWVAGFTTLTAAAFMSAVASERNTRLARFLSVRAFVLLGGASYAFYLFHQPAHFAMLRLAGGSKLILALQYPVLLASALLIFLLVEEPAREWVRKRAGMKRSVIGEAVALPAG
ncbi:acyltransferase [Sphingomonas sp.]|uniref:acyltransferase family protein n=1 Tax=Sphingomonas sp. TaxID=28214 RepID=UPI0025FFF9F2|nr:acyltransferase [Sphingomonas sp.]